MTQSEYSFLIPTDQDFPDEQVKKKRSVKKEDPKESDDDEDDS